MKWTDPGLVAELTVQGTTVCRIASDHASRIDRYGDRVLFSHAGREPASSDLQQLQDWLRDAGIGIVQIYAQRLVVRPTDLDAPRLIFGDPSLGAETVVMEGGLRFAVDLLGGYSSGLFLDQRANRARLRRRRPARVLNTFAYTCSFSVVAASIGSRTLSVDLARAALDRGRENFALNDFSLEGHRFIADDMMAVFPRLVRRGEKFDAIILDPPTFARSSGRRPFRVEDDLPLLLDWAALCLDPRGAILVSTNCSSLDERRLRRLVSNVCPRAACHVESLPPDLAGIGTASTLWADFA